MRHFFIFFIVGVFFALFARYIFTTPETPPLNQEMILNLIKDKEIGPDDSKKLDEEIQNLINRGLIFNYLSTNAYLLAFSILVSIFCFFVSIHLFVDKLFFKNFYEKASIFNAVRRGLLLCLTLGLLVFFRLYRVETYVLVAVPLAAIAIESIFSINEKNRVKKQEDEPEVLAVP